MLVISLILGMPTTERDGYLSHILSQQGYHILRLTKRYQYAVNMVFIIINIAIADISR